MADEAKISGEAKADSEAGASQNNNNPTQDNKPDNTPAQDNKPAEETKKSKNKKSKKDSDNTPESEADKIFEDVRNTLELRRTAKEAKRYKILIRIFALTALILIMLIAAAYAISYFYDKYGSFTVRIDRYDMVQQGLSLSETPDYNISQAVLNADIVYNMTNISGQDLPPTVDQINGAHNGDNFIAYTFYLINSGDDTISYKGDLVIENVTKNVDDAVRVAVYKNGNKTVYGKTKSGGGGKEKDCDETFLSSTIVMQTDHENFKPKEKDKYTVVIWLEGNDPDCLDDIVGGTIKFGMNFSIVETT